MFWEKFTKAYPIKATALLLIAALTVVSCGGQAAVSRSLDRLNYDSLPADAPRPTKPAEKLHAAVTELTELLAVQAERDLSGEQAENARAARTRVDRELRAVQRQFAADRTKLESLGGKKALTRLDAIEAKATGLERSVRAALAKVPPDGDHAPAAADAAQALSALSPAKPSQPLSSEPAFAIKNGKPRRPALSARLTPAYGSPTPTETASRLPRSPEPEDLEQTPETQVTPAIRALAEELDRDPVRIFEYVHDTIRYEPYYGIRKGADQTLVEAGGSDADQAALLIALLRESGIHARFVQGLAELPADRAANWLGVDVAGGQRLDAAPEILWAGGVPTTQIRSDGRLSRLRFDHVWAEAYVPADAYRGVDEGLGGRAWLPLDPSIKETRFVEPVADLHEVLDPIVGPWAERVVDDAGTSAEPGVITPPSAGVVAEARQVIVDAADELEQAAGEDGTVGDIVGVREIVEAPLPYLAGATPFRTLTVSSESRAVPSALQASVTFAVRGADPFSLPDLDFEGGEDGLTYTAPTSDLVNKRVTVTYVPATDADAEIIDAYHGLLNAPSYAAALIPVLRVDGRVVARGTGAASTGYAQSFRITYRMPGFAADTVENPVYVGSLSAFALDLGVSAPKRIRDRGAAWLAAPPDVTADNVLTDRVGGELMSVLGLSYFTRNDSLNAILAEAGGVRQQRSVSGLLVATDISPTYVASFPVGTRLTGMSMDVDQDAQSVVALEDEEDAPAQYMRVSGANSSAQEGRVFETAFGESGVSTMKVMEVAAARQIPIYSVTQDTAANLLPQLNISRAAREEVSAAAEQEGVTVVVPRDEVEVGGWRGTGYTIYRGDSADYRIMGGASGGFMSFIDAVNNFTSLTYWADRFGAPDPVVNTMNCVGFGNDVLGMMLGVASADSVWGLVTMVLGRLLPIALSGVGLVVLTAIFLTLFFIYIFFSVYSAAESGPRCRDDIIDSSGG